MGQYWQQLHKHSMEWNGSSGYVMWWAYECSGFALQWRKPAACTSNMYLQGTPTDTWCTSWSWSPAKTTLWRKASGFWCGAWSTYSQIAPQWLIHTASLNVATRLLLCLWASCPHPQGLLLWGGGLGYPGAHPVEGRCAADARSAGGVRAQTAPCQVDALHAV